MEEPRRAHNVARTGGRLFPLLFSHLHFAFSVTFFGAGGAVGGEWRPQEEVSVWCLSTFQVGPCAPRRKCALAILVGAVYPKNKCLPAKGFSVCLRHNRVLVIYL